MTVTGSSLGHNFTDSWYLEYHWAKTQEAYVFILFSCSPLSGESPCRNEYDDHALLSSQGAARNLVLYHLQLMAGENYDTEDITYLKSTGENKN